MCVYDYLPVDLARFLRRDSGASFSEFALVASIVDRGRHYRVNCVEQGLGLVLILRFGGGSGVRCRIHSYGYWHRMGATWCNCLSNS